MGNLRVGKGSLAPTRDKCGPEFALLESKGNFQVSKWVIYHINRQSKETREQGGAETHIVIKNSAHRIYCEYRINVYRV